MLLHRNHAEECHQDELTLAIVHQMADRDDWMPGVELQAVCKELWETREWLVAVQEQSKLPTPCKGMPTRHEPMNPLGLQKDTLEAGNPVDQVGDKANEGKRVMPPQSKGRKGSKVAEADQMEHLLSGGQWEGLSAIHKGGEIRVKVSTSWRCIEDHKFQCV